MPNKPARKVKPREVKPRKGWGLTTKDGSVWLAPIRTTRKELVAWIREGRCTQEPGERIIRVLVTPAPRARGKVKR